MIRIHIEEWKIWILYACITSWSWTQTLEAKFGLEYWGGGDDEGKVVFAAAAAPAPGGGIGIP